MIVELKLFHSSAILQPHAPALGHNILNGLLNEYALHERKISKQILQGEMK